MLSHGKCYTENVAFFVEEKGVLRGKKKTCQCTNIIIILVKAHNIAWWLIPYLKISNKGATWNY